MYYVKDKYRNRTWNRYVSKWNWVVPFPRHRDELLCVSSATSRLISHESIQNRLTDVKRIMKQLISFDNEKEYIFDDLNNFQTENGWIFFSFQLNLSPRLKRIESHLKIISSFSLFQKKLLLSILYLQLFIFSSYDPHCSSSIKR